MERKAAELGRVEFRGWSFRPGLIARDVLVAVPTAAREFSAHLLRRRGRPVK